MNFKQFANLRFILFTVPFGEKYSEQNIVFIYKVSLPKVYYIFFQSINNKLNDELRFYLGTPMKYFD